MSGVSTERCRVSRWKVGVEVVQHWYGAPCFTVDCRLTLSLGRVCTGKVSAAADLVRFMCRGWILYPVHAQASRVDVNHLYKAGRWIAQLLSRLSDKVALVPYLGTHGWANGG